jgi:hypothetical protein
VRDVHGIDPQTKVRIMDFLQGAIYCWVKNRKGEAFAVRDLVGGENGNWAGTPLQGLYDKHLQLGKSEDAASQAAGQDIGWLVKAVLDEDKREFEAVEGAYVNSYQWVGHE